MLNDELVYEMAVRTDPGRYRSHNEDAVFADARLGLAILADGMGGYRAGEVASGMAVNQLAGELGRIIQSQPWRSRQRREAARLAQEHLVAEIGAANLEIFHQSARNEHHAGMGTTLVVGWLHGGTLTTAHVGDSRAYRLRGERFERLTRDHSLLQEQLDHGLISPEEARHAEHRNLVTRALGVEPTVEIDIQQHDLKAGDIILLCSDGLNDMIDDHAIAVALRTLADNPALAADHLIALALEHGGRDNVSVILVKALPGPARACRWWQRILNRLG